MGQLPCCVAREAEKTPESARPQRPPSFRNKEDDDTVASDDESYFHNDAGAGNAVSSQHKLAHPSSSSTLATATRDPESAESDSVIWGEMSGRSSLITQRTACSPRIPSPSLKDVPEGDEHVDKSTTSARTLHGADQVKAHVSDEASQVADEADTTCALSIAHKDADVESAKEQGQETHDGEADALGTRAIDDSTSGNVIRDSIKDEHDADEADKPIELQPDSGGPPVGTACAEAPTGSLISSAETSAPTTESGGCNEEKPLDVESLDGGHPVAAVSEAPTQCGPSSRSPFEEDNEDQCVQVAPRAMSRLPPTAHIAGTSDPLLHSLSTWYVSPESCQGKADPSIENSLTNWYADGKPLPDARTDRTEVHAMAQSLNAWYAAPDPLNEEKPKPADLSTWYNDDEPGPDCQTPHTEMFPLSERVPTTPLAAKDDIIDPEFDRFGARRPSAVEVHSLSERKSSLT